MAVGPGRIKVIGDQPTTVVGDMFNQTILGGAGNDVLGSGGGNDVLRGGAGLDTFLLGGAGHVTIDDYTAGDVMKFNVFGVNSLAQLASQVTYAAQDAQGVTFRIGADLTVTLTGLSLSSNYTDAMFAFGA
jgi:Ca2+-binding RTX toxin-like protein